MAAVWMDSAHLGHCLVVVAFILSRAAKKTPMNSRIGNHNSSISTKLSIFLTALRKLLCIDWADRYHGKNYAVKKLCKFI
jgi:hypothetical protein